MIFKDPLAALRGPSTVRARCAAVTRAVEEGRSGHFKLDRSRLPEVARRVAALTRERFPDLKIPYHSRWRHFEAGGVDRKGELDTLLAGRSAADVARARIDLAVVSALLDAGAGPKWHFVERPELDALALPVHRQKGEDLLAMLGAATGVAKPKAAALAPQADVAWPAGADAAPDAAPDAVPEAVPEALHDEPPSAAPDLPALSAAAPAQDRPAEKAPENTPQRATFTRSEGLGVASFRAFVAGVFSSDPTDPLRVDALALKRLDAAALRAVFQASPSNPLVGLEGRAALLTRLGEVLQAQARTQGGLARPGRLYDTLTEGEQRREVAASDILRELLTAYAPIWTSGSRVLGLPAGDVWPHLWAGGDTVPARRRDALAEAPARGGADSRAPQDPRPDRATGGWVPFHKLSQWLTYSLLEPLEWAGVTVTGLDDLTGLPEYRNGGLLLDGGVIVPRAPRDLTKTWKPADEFTIEWRAMTVTLLDELAVLVRQELGVSAQQMPLACVLEGGTWAAGRQIARELREGGAPPVQIDSDGTVF